MAPFKTLSAMLIAGVLLACGFAGGIFQASAQAPFVVAESDVEVIEVPPQPVYGGHSEPEPWQPGEREAEWEKPRAQTPPLTIKEPPSPAPQSPPMIWGHQPHPSVEPGWTHFDR